MKYFTLLFFSFLLPVYLEVTVKMGILDNLINNFSNRTNNTSFDTEQYIFVELDQVIKKFENTNKRKKNIELKIEEFLNNELNF